MYLCTCVRACVCVVVCVCMYFCTCARECARVCACRSCVCVWVEGYWGYCSMHCSLPSSTAMHAHAPPPPPPLLLCRQRYSPWHLSGDLYRIGCVLLILPLPPHSQAKATPSQRFFCRQRHSPRHLSESWSVSFTSISVNFFLGTSTERVIPWSFTSISAIFFFRQRHCLRQLSESWSVSSTSTLHHLKASSQSERCDSVYVRTCVPNP